MRPVLSCGFSILLLVFLCFEVRSDISIANPTNLVTALRNGGAYVEDAKGRMLFSHRMNEPFIPASTIKVATAATALHTLGGNYRFRTEFFLTADRCLAIKGLGDPALTSKELKTISGILARKVKQIECFIVDNSFFDYRSKFNGRSNTNNPYDALNSAFMVNFNTVALRVLGSGTVLSNEPETPLTEIARRRGLALSRGNHRVNFGTSLEEGGVNGVQILAHFLRENGLRVANKVFFAPIPKQSNLLYNHSSSLRLTEALNGMLKYSNNVVANQIFLFLGAHKYGAPATFEKGQKVVNNFLTKEIGWRVGKVVEGSGLSRETRVTPYEMVRLLRWFEVYESLLPEESNSQVKTGTLNGVNALVGFTTVHKSEKIRFALLVNSQVPFNYKFKVLELLKRSVL